MTCTVIVMGNSTRVFLCHSPFYRLRLRDGTCVFMEWHNYCGPTFYRDRDAHRVVETWWNDPRICAALDWFCKRGNKA